VQLRELDEAADKLVYDAGVVLVDVEGTICPSDFVENVLLPYAAARLRGYAVSRRFLPAVAAVLEEARQLSGGDPIAALEAWQADGVQTQPLKTLQGWIWTEGYIEGALSPPLFADALAALRRWRSHGVPLYVFSSGSLAAQKLFFRSSREGDLRGLFNGHYDTTVGAKTDPDSYREISESIGVATGAILFLSDSADEVAAASAAGFQIGHVAKETAPDRRWPTIRDFGEIELIRRQ